MSRVKLEHDYWNLNALDKEVDIKYISDIDIEKCKKDLPIMKGEVLEIGCGVGRLMHDGWHGIDISENMLAIAKERNSKLILKKNDGRTIPYPDKTFNWAYCYLVFQHLPKDAVEQYIKEAYRVLKIGGSFVFQWIEGNENEPFSKHLLWTDVREFTSDFKDVRYSKSKAYEGWEITRCIK